MLKQLLNECTIALNIIPQGPILVKGPDVEKEESEADTSEPDMKFVLTRRNNRDEPYLPGGSLKGVMRSHAEKIARSLAPSFGCCNPFWTFRNEGKDNNISDPCKGEISCSDKLEILSKVQPLSSCETYNLSCPICRLFGNSGFGSRFAVADAYLSTNFQPPLPYRDGVAIDRFTGGAKGGAKFRYEVLEKGSFTAHIRIRNFELWQLGLVAYILKDMDDGIIRIGFGKRRGLGKVRGQVSSIGVSYFGSARPQWKAEDTSFAIWGVGKQLGGEGADYGFKSEDIVEIQSKPDFKNAGVRTTLRMDLNTLYLNIAKCWNDYIGDYSIPDKMTFANIERCRQEVENAANT